MLPTQPLRRDDKLVDGDLNQFIQDYRKRNGNALSDLRVGEDPLGSFFVAGGAYLLAWLFLSFRRAFRRSILTGSFSNAMD